MPVDFQALNIANAMSACKANLLKSCLDVHGNVILALAGKKPKDLICDGYVLRYVRPILSGAALTLETLTLLNSFNGCL